MLQFMGSQRVGHNLVIEQQQQRNHRVSQMMVQKQICHKYKNILLFTVQGGTHLQRTLSQIFTSMNMYISPRFDVFCTYHAP